MKKILWIAAVLVITFAVGSCEKQIIENSNQEPEFQEMVTADDLPELKMYEGMLWFENEEQFRETINVLGSMNDDEKLKWEESMGFVSLYTVYNSVYEQMDNAKSQEEFDAILEKSDNFFHLEEFEDDYRVVENIEISAFQLISDYERMYVIGDTVYKIFDGKIIKTKKSNYENLYSSVMDLSNCKIVNLFDENDSKSVLYIYKKDGTGFRGYYLDSDIEKAVWMELGRGPGYITYTVWGEKKSWGAYRKYKSQLYWGLDDVKICNYEFDYISGSVYAKDYSKTKSIPLCPFLKNFDSYNIWARNSDISPNKVWYDYN